MTAVAFLHPALLWALPLAAIPVVIHLLNRRRFQRVRWAAQEFLLAALKRNRRRLRLEQWLVLLLRTLAVVLLVLLVTRPQLVGSAFAQARTHHVVCLDDSASMAQRSGAGDVFAEAVDRVQLLVDRLAQAREGDLFTLLRTSRPSRPELAAARVGPPLQGRAREVLASWRVGDASAQLGRALEEAQHRATETPEARAEIYLVTDFRRTDWLGDDQRPRPDVARALQALAPERARLTVLAVGPPDVENVAIVEVQRAGRLAIGGVPVDLTVEVKNQGIERSRPTEVALAADGQSRVVLLVEALEPGESRALTFSHTFHGAGFHGINAALPADRYPVDDERAMALEVVESSRVLVVDGDPGERPEEAESYYLAFALEHREAGIAVEVVPDHALVDQDLAAADMVFLCNAPAPAAAVVAKLEEFVAAGGGLVFFLGDQVDPRRYGGPLYADGNGLLPARLVDLDGDIDRPQPIAVADPTHGTLAVAGETLQRLLGFTRVGRWFGVDQAPGAPARTVLCVGAAGGPPLLLARTFRTGGEVMLVTTTADDKWTELPKTPAFLVLVQQMHRIAAKAHDQSTYNLSTEGALALAVDSARYRADVVVRRLVEDGGEHTFTASAAAEGEEPVLTLPMRQLTGLGLFEVALIPYAGERERRLLARNAPAVEGMLQRLGETAWQRAFPEELHDRVTVVEGSAKQGALLEASFGEAWRALALAMLGALLVESALAWRFGRR